MSLMILMQRVAENGPRRQTAVVVVAAAAHPDRRRRGHGQRAAAERRQLLLVLLLVLVPLLLVPAGHAETAEAHQPAGARDAVVLRLGARQVVVICSCNVCEHTGHANLKSSTQINIESHENNYSKWVLNALKILLYEKCIYGKTKKKKTVKYVLNNLNR